MYFYFKKAALLGATAIFVFATSVAKAQPAATTDSLKKPPTVIKSGRFPIEIRLRPMRIEAQQLYFEFTDESPSKDKLIGNFSLKEKKQAMSLAASLEGQAIDRRLFFRLGGEASFNQWKYVFYGWHLGIDHLFYHSKVAGFSAGLAIGCNYSRIKLGKISQNATYIQINGQRFFAEDNPSLTVSLHGGQYFLQPSIAIFPLTERGLQIRCGYQLPAGDLGNSIKFEGTNSDGSGKSVKKSIDNEKLILLRDGTEKVNESVSDFSGFFLQLGFVL